MGTEEYIDKRAKELTDLFNKHDIDKGKGKRLMKALFKANLIMDEKEITRQEKLHICRVFFDIGDRDLAGFFLTD